MDLINLLNKTGLYIYPGILSFMRPMKQIVFILLIPSLLMAGLGVYWISMVRMLDGKRTEFLERPEFKSHQQFIDGLISGQTQPTQEKYRDALKQQQSIIEWERGYFEMLRRNMFYLGWIAWLVALCQVAAVYYIHKRFRDAPT
jgi:hypothetical protein